jgi:hypothetical protein
MPYETSADAGGRRPALAAGIRPAGGRRLRPGARPGTLRGPPGRPESLQREARAEKAACLEAAMPPVDCRRSENPGKCEATQKAREACKGKTGKALKQCMRDEKPKKKPRPIRPAA